MNLFTFSSVCVVVTSSLMAILVFLKTTDKKVNYVWGCFCTAVAVWGVGSGMATISTNYSSALFWWQVAYTGIVYAPIFFANFVFNYLKLNRKLFLRIIYSLSLVVIFLIWYNNSRLFFVELPYRFNKFYWPHWIKFKSLSWIGFYVFFYWLVPGYAHFLLIKHYKNTSGFRRNQFKYFILGAIVGWLGAELCYLPDFNINVYPAYPNFFIAIYPLIMGYAIIRYRLMEINVALTRASIFAVVYGLILGIPFWLGYTSKEWLPPTLLAVALASAGPFMYGYLRRHAENMLLAQQRQYQKTLKQAAEGMVKIKDLSRLVNLVVHIITRSVKVDSAAIFHLDDARKHYKLGAHRGNRLSGASEMTLSQKHPVVKHLIKTGEPLLQEDVPFVIKDKNAATEIQVFFERFKVQLVIPFLIEDNLFGILALGQKPKNQIFTQDDIDVFKILANQAALAIENCLFFEEVKKTQEKLLQAERLAAAGTLASGLAHEIRNPLTSIKTFADFIEEKYDDPKFRKNFKKLVPAELDRIDAIITQLIEFAQPAPLQPGSTDVHKVLDEALDLIELQLGKLKITLKKEYAHNIPRLQADRKQLKQAFFNILLNAIDAMPDGGKLKVGSIFQSKQLIITISDTGKGIHPDDLPYIFDAFYTKKNKGSGLGLAVTYGILRNHNADIQVKSRVNEGTSFMITFPVDNNHR